MWLTGSVLLLSTLLVTWLLLERHRSQKNTTQILVKVIEDQDDLIDKLTVLLSTKDPLAFQAVQAMGMQYPQSEQPVLTTAEDTTEEGLDGFESSALRDIIGG